MYINFVYLDCSSTTLRICYLSILSFPVKKKHLNKSIEYIIVLHVHMHVSLQKLNGCFDLAAIIIPHYLILTMLFSSE